MPIGLLSPTQRSGAGYRLYGGADVRRLYEILALRQLGLSLEKIADAINGETSSETMLVAHSDHVDVQLAAMRTLQTHMATVLAMVRRRTRPTDTDLLDLIRKVMTVDARVEYRMQEDNTEKIQRDFGGPTPEQIEFVTRANEAAQPGTA